VIALLAWCASAAAQQQVHITSRMMYLEVDPGEDGEFQFVDETVFSHEAMLIGGSMLAGIEGDMAEGQGRVDLRTGELGASAAIQNASYPSGWSSATASSSVEMRDTLLITTPPGNYPDGVPVIIPYQITGVLQADLQNPLGGPVTGFNMLAAVRMALGITTFEDIVDLVSAPSVVTVNRQGELRTTIEPFFSYTEKVTEMGMAAYIDAQAETAGVDPDPLAASGIDLGVYYDHTVTLGPLQVPEGVTWTSESGFFLAGEPVPEPAGLGLMAALVLLRRKRR